MHKMADGLLSGRYSHPAKAPPAPTTTTDTPFSSDSVPQFQEGIRPAMFKDLVGKGHVEFSTMRQQDSEEFLQYFLDRLRQEAKKSGFSEENEATQTFRFSLEQRLQCTSCQGVSYKTDSADTVSLPVPFKEKEMVANATEDGASAPAKQYESVPLTECMEMFVGNEAIEYNCPQCKKQVSAIK